MKAVAIQGEKEKKGFKYYFLNLRLLIPNTTYW